MQSAGLTETRSYPPIQNLAEASILRYQEEHPHFVYSLLAPVDFFLFLFRNIKVNNNFFFHFIYRNPRDCHPIKNLPTYPFGTEGLDTEICHPDFLF